MSKRGLEQVAKWIKVARWFGVMLTVICSCLMSSTAFGLSDGRVYEQVSPSYKGGYGVGVIRMVSPDGERLAFDSLGVFAGVQWDTLESVYLASRADAVGWSTSSLQPPPIAGIIDFSSNFSHVLAGLSVGKTKTGVEGPETGREYLLHQVDLPNIPANWEVFGGMELKLIDEKPFDGVNLGSSSDLCHNILGFSGPLLPKAAKTLLQIYDQSRGCDGSEPSLRLVALDDSNNVINGNCRVVLGLESIAYSDEEQESNFNAIDANGSIIFFTVNVKPGTECGAGGHQLFARLGDETTVEISKPVSETCSEVPCPGAGSRPSAYFKGASEDGSHVFFTTHAPLVGEDLDNGSDLYLATIGCGEGEEDCGVGQRRVVSLTQISRSPGAGAADVAGVLRVAPDGSHVYFVAKGVLVEGVNTEGQAPVSSADNLYVYDVVSGEIKFITDLCSGPASSGEINDLNCPSDAGGNDASLWGTSHWVQSTRDGRILVFSSYGQLLEDDADSARDVYRYDAVSGLMARVSIGEGGFGANGNLGRFDANIAPLGIGTLAHEKLELVSRAVSDDGLRVVFTSAAPLSPRAVNGRENVYEWFFREGEDGGVSLLSGGASLTSDEDVTVSPSGRDVFFVTAEGLVPGDTDGLRDVYDARIGGGFPEAPAPRQPCSGDTCQGPLTNPEPLLVAGSMVQAAGENYSPPGKKKAPPKKRKKRHLRRGKRHSGKAKSGTARSGTMSLSVVRGGSR